MSAKQKSPTLRQRVAMAEDDSLQKSAVIHDLRNEITALRAPVRAHSVAFAHFYQASSFGPYIECKPDHPESFPAYRAERQGVALTDAQRLDIALAAATMEAFDIGTCGATLRALLAQAQPANHIEDSRQMVGADDVRNAARWRILVAALDNPDGPEGDAVELAGVSTGLASEDESTEKMTLILDAAIASLGSAKPAPLAYCAANRDGECGNPQCSQLRDDEPAATGRSCLIPDKDDE